MKPTGESVLKTKRMPGRLKLKLLEQRNSFEGCTLARPAMI